VAPKGRNTPILFRFSDLCDDNDLVNSGTNLAMGSTLTAAPVSKRMGNK